MGWRPQILPAFLGGFLAFLGAFFGYEFTVYQKGQETEAKQRELFTSLRRELGFIPMDVQPYDVRKVIYMDSIRLVSLDRLLDGETLRYSKDGPLIQSLMHLRVAVSKYNDLVQTTNLAQSTVALPDTAHAQIYANVVQLHQGVIAARDDVLGHLPR